MRLFRLFIPRNIATYVPTCAESARQDARPWKASPDLPQPNDTTSWHLVILVLLPIAVLTIATGLFRFTDVDRLVSQWAYHDSTDPWPWAHTQLCDFIYSYGTLPGIFLGVGGLAVALVGSVWHRLRPYRRAGFFVAAMLALGPGLMVNGILKPQWCRPRPCQTAEFGGNQDFVSVWNMGTFDQCKSFPSGHASMGFLLMGPAFLLYRRRQRLAAGFVLLGLAAGMALGVTRILQGGHFLSDVVWAAGMVYFSGLALVGLYRLAERWTSTSLGNEDEVHTLPDSDALRPQEHDSEAATRVPEAPSRRHAA
jgi:lipid A 4'-phosphatase